MSQVPNEQALPAGIQNPAAPAAPATNPMLSAVSNPPTVEEALKPAAPKPEPKIEVPSAPTAEMGDLVQGFLADPQVQLATSYMDAVAADNKLDLTRALGKGFENADSRFIDEPYIKEVLKDKADNFIKAAKSTVDYIQHKQASLVSDIHTSAGGEAAWNQAVNAFKSVASKEEQAALTDLLNSGNSESIKYAAKRIVEIGRSSGAVITHSVAALGANGAKAGLSAAEYKAALVKEGRNIAPTKYQELRELRAIGKQHNI